MTHTFIVMRRAAVIAIAAAAIGCSSDDGPGGPGDPGTPTVSAGASSVFAPALLEITTGESVTWDFGALQHTVDFAAVAGAPANIPATNNAEVSRTFGTAGDFAYSCSIHAGMNGTIRVTD